MFLGATWVGGGEDRQWGSTVEPLCRGHHQDPAGCLVKRGVPNSGVDLYTALCGWDCRHCPHSRGVLIQSDFCREVPLCVCACAHVCERHCHFDVCGIGLETEGGASCCDGWTRSRAGSWEGNSRISHDTGTRRLVVSLVISCSECLFGFIGLKCT